MNYRMLSGLACLLLAGEVGAASFDCQRAGTPVEKRVCANGELSTLDEHLGRYYQVAREYVREAADCLKIDQAQWLKQVRNACTTDGCLQQAYLERLSVLDAVQPGASAAHGIELPAKPALVWIVPPSTDQVAAPPRPDAKPLEVTGTLVDQRDNGDGFVVRTAEGVDYTLALLQLAEPSSFEYLANLAWERHNRFQAKGYLTMDGDKAYFEPSRCTFVYRLP